MSDLLSAALIVRDEAAVLRACLDSLRDVVDEVVVVDTGSVDETPAIATSAGATVDHVPWTGDFASARNAALDRCRGEWILYIDADERLAPTSRGALEALLADAPEVAFRLLLRPRVHATPYREYRLWRNDARIRFAGAIHEKVVPAIHRVSATDRRPVGICDLLLEHVGYEGDQTRKHRRNLPLLRRQLEAEPENLFNWHHLARVLTGLGEREEAERVLAHAIDVARGKPVIDEAGVLAYTDLVAARHERGEDVTGLLVEARAQYPGNWQLRWLQAGVLIRRGQFEEALTHLDALLAADLGRLPDEGPSYDERIFGEFAHDARGLCLFRLARADEAASAWAAALRCAPREAAYRTKLALARARAAQEGAAVE